MKSESVLKTKREVKRKMSGWIIVLIIIAVLSAGGAIVWSNTISKEHYEAKNLPIYAVDFRRLNDGTYIGEYEGGIYKWRANKVQVIVTSGKVTNIKLLSAKMPEKETKDSIHAKIYDRVIKAQSLQVDAISGATLTSKGYLKAVENALKQAPKKVIEETRVGL